MYSLLEEPRHVGKQTGSRTSRFFLYNARHLFSTIHALLITTDLITLRKPNENCSNLV